MEKQSIKFNKPAVIGNELSYIKEALRNDRLSGDGTFTMLCQALLEQELGTPKVFLTTSGTHALEMASFLLDIQPGDEVILPSFNFVSDVNAFIIRGARPVFIDIHPHTLNLDETQLECLITPRTRVIVPVHYAGVGCEMDAIMETASRHGIAVVEDNAHGLFGKYKGKYLGTFGEFATQSFHETKSYTCGEGGALIINDPEFIERAEIIRDKGTNRSHFFRGQVNRYSWVDLGSSYMPSDILAAFLFAQLEKRDEIQAARRFVWDYYYTHLQSWAQENEVCLPFVPNYCEQSYAMFYMIMPSIELRQELIAFLRERGIQSVFHYQSLHLSDMGKKFGGIIGDCPMTEDISERLLRLPFYTTLAESDLSRILETVIEFRA
jgi:dTDP-4-amino-4,6-dideoxygalactose transaminase